MTCMEVMLRPDATFARMEPKGSVKDSVLFMFLCGCTGFLPTVVFFFAIEPLLSGRPESIDVPSFASWLVVLPLANAVGSFLAACLDNVILRMVGARVPLESTMRGYALSQGVYLLGLVPVLSLYVILIWSFMARVTAYHHGGRMGWRQAAVGVFWVWFLALGLLGLCGAGLFWLFDSAVRENGGIR